MLLTRYAKIKWENESQRDATMKCLEEYGFTISIDYAYNKSKKSYGVILDLSSHTGAVRSTWAMACSCNAIGSNITSYYDTDSFKKDYDKFYTEHKTEILEIIKNEPRILHSIVNIILREDDDKEKLEIFLKSKGYSGSYITISYSRFDSIEVAYVYLKEKRYEIVYDEDLGRDFTYKVMGLSEFLEQY